MHKFFLQSVLAVLIILHESHRDREISEGDIYCKALGRSGKISIGFKENIDSDPNRITVEFDDLMERDSSGNEVGKTGSEKHSFNSFASQDFQFTDTIDDTLQNISAKSFQFQATLFDNARLNVTVYVFKEDGTLEIGDEETNVTRGNVKFSISLENWKFCGTGNGEVSCRKGNTDETGSFIDFTITIKGKGATRETSDTSQGAGGKTRGKRFELGGKSAVILSEKVKYNDGSWTNMASGYPQTVIKGSKTSFVFRFDKFSQSVFYDPTINAGEESSNGSAHVHATFFVLLSAIFTLYFI